MKKEFILALTLFIAPFFMSCSDNETTSNEQDQEALDASIRDSLRTQGLILALCRVETSDDGTLNYLPRIGTAIEPATPTVYYHICKDLESARATFRNLLFPLDYDEEKLLEIDEVRQGNIHLKFSESTTPGELARITVDCTNLKDVLTEIVFVTQERWPANDKGSPFNLLSIWRNNNDNRVYVCVRIYQSSDGILLSFNGPHEEEKFDEYTYYQGEFSLYKNTASAEAIECLSNLLRDSHDLFTDMFNIMNARVKDPHWMWKSLYNGVWQRFDHNYTYTHGLYWLFHNCYYVDLYKSSINHPKVGKYGFYKEKMHYEHEETPKRESASHEIRFKADFNMDGWTCIYKGT